MMNYYLTFVTELLLSIKRIIANEVTLSPTSNRKDVMSPTKIMLVSSLFLFIGLSANAQTTYYSKASATNFFSAASWGPNTDGSGVFPGTSAINGNNFFVIANNSAITLNANATVGKLTLNSGSLTVGANTLNIQDAALNMNNKTTLAVNSPATLTVSGGTVNLYGNMTLASGGTFNQSGGNFNVDGNNGGSATGSVATGTVIVNWVPLNFGSVNLTGGTFTIVDPHVGTATSDYVFNFAYSTAGNTNTTTGHTFRYGDGVSTDGTTNTGGFIVYNWPGTGGFRYGNLIINGAAANRLVTSPSSYGAMPVLGNLTINANSELRQTGTSYTTQGMIFVGGDLINNGTLTTTQPGVYFGNAFYTNSTTITPAPATIAQTVSGTGKFRNATTDAGSTANFGALSFNNASTSGVIFSNSNSLLCKVSPVNNTGTVATTTTTTSLYLINGDVNLSSGTFVLGSSVTVPSAISFTAGGFNNGTLTRWLTTSTLSTSATTPTANFFPFSKNGANRSIGIATSAAITTAGYLSATYTDAAALNSTVSFTDAGYTAQGGTTINRRTNASWSLSAANVTGLAANTLAASTQTFPINLNPNGIVLMNVAPAASGAPVITSATASAPGTHATPGGTAAAPVAVRTGMTLAQVTANTFYVGLNNTVLDGFYTVASGDWATGSTWSGGAAPGAKDLVKISPGHAITVTSGTNLAAGIQINGSGSLSVSAGSLDVTGGVTGTTLGVSVNTALGAVTVSGTGTLTIGSTGQRVTTFSNTGTLNVTGGTLTVNGNVVHLAGSNFNQSGGTININGSNGLANYVSTGNATSSSNVITLATGNTTGLNVGNVITVSGGIGALATATTVTAKTANTITVSPTPTTALSGAAIITAAQSVASGTALLSMASQLVNLTGGSTNIINPHLNGTSTSTNRALEYNNAVSLDLGNAHTFNFGNGSATLSGNGTAANGFNISGNVGTGRIAFGNLTVNGTPIASNTTSITGSSSASIVTVTSTEGLTVGSLVTVASGTGAFAAGSFISVINTATTFTVNTTPTTALVSATIEVTPNNRQVTVVSPTTIGVLGNLLVDGTDGEFRFNTSTVNVAGNVTCNAGNTITNNGTLGLQTYSSAVTTPALAAQTVSGAGRFRNSSVTANAATTACHAAITINNTNASGVTFSGNAVYNSNLGAGNAGTHSGTLTFTTGIVNVSGSNPWFTGHGVTTPAVGPISITAGGFGSGTTVARWLPSGNVGSTITSATNPTATGTLGNGAFPFVSGTGATQVSRHFNIARATTTGDAAGTIRVKYNDVAGVTNITSITDSPKNVNTVTNSNWVVTTGNGFAKGTAEVNKLAATVNGIFTVLANTNLTIVQGATAATATTIAGSSREDGLASAMNAHRASIPVTTALAGTYYVGYDIQDAPIQTQSSGNWNDANTWVGGAVPSCPSNVQILNTHAVAVPSGYTASVGSVILSGNGSIDVQTGGILNVGCSGNNASLSLTSTSSVTVSGGSLNVNGSIDNPNGTSFSQSGGTITVDGNSGVLATSVATGTPIVNLAGTVSLSGGTLIIVDPHAGTAQADMAFKYDNAASISATGHTIQFGDGSSTQSTLNPRGFLYDFYFGTGRMMAGNIIVNTSTLTGNRFVSPYYASTIQQVLGNMTITSGEFRNYNTNTLSVAGNLTNNGKLTSPGTVAASSGSGVSTLVASANAQTISGSGEFIGNLPAVTVAAGGSGYAVGDILTISGGTNTTPATFYVSTVSAAGAVTGLICVSAGTGYTVAPPAASATTTSGTGTGCTLTPDTTNVYNAFVNTANYNGFTVNNSNDTGVTLNSTSLLSGTNTGTVNGTLTFTQGYLKTDSNAFVLGTSATTVGTLVYTAGGFGNGSTFTRWIGSAIGGSTIVAAANPSGVAGRFPFIIGTIAAQTDRSFYYNQTTAAATGGQLSVKYNDAATLSNVSFTDDTYNINRKTDANWVVSQSGITGPNADYSLAAAATNLFTASNNNTRLTLSGSIVAGSTHLAAAATPLPAGQRSFVSLANLANTYYLGINDNDVPFISVASSDWNTASTWNKNAVPTSADQVIIATGTTVAVSTAAAASIININGVLNVGAGANLAVTAATSGTGITTTATTGQLNISAGTVTIGTGSTRFSRITNNGTLAVSGTGILNVNGNLIASAGSTFNQSGGNINVDGNAGGNPSNSVASTSTSFSYAGSIVFLQTSSLNLTGGKLTIVDPHAGASTTYDMALAYSGSNVALGTGHTIQFGDGVSTDAGGHTNGFYNYVFVGSGYLTYGNVVVDIAAGANRFYKSTNTIGILGDLTISQGEYQLANTTYIAGNVINNGILTATSTLNLATWTSGAASASANTQTISGSGTFRNLTASPTAGLTSLTVNNTNATGVTLSVPLSISGTLTMTSGKINTSGTSVLTLGTATAAGTLVCTPSTANLIYGPFARTFAASRTAAGTYDATTLFPVGSASTLLPIYIDPTTKSSGAVVFTGQAFNSNSGTFSGAANSLSSSRFTALPSSGAANLTSVLVRLSDANITTTNKILSASSDAGSYSPIASATSYGAGSPNTVTTVDAFSAASYTGYLAYGNVNDCTTPSNAPTNLVIVTATTSAITASYTAAVATPNPASGYLVVRYANPPVNIIAPSNFTTSYSAGSTLGGGIVAYNGTAVTFTDSGLATGTTYNYYVYSYQNSFCNGPVFYGTPLINALATCAASTGVPGTPVDSLLTTSSLTATWTASSTASVNYFIDVATNSGFTSFVSGYNNLNVGTALTANITGLSSNTPYWIRVRAGLGGCSSTFATLNVTTLCDAVAIGSGILQNFDASTATPDCWSKNARWIIDTVSGFDGYTPFSAPNLVYKAYNNANDANLFSLPFDMTSAPFGATVSMKLYRTNDSFIPSTDGYEIMVNTSPKMAGATTLSTIPSYTGLDPTATVSGYYDYTATIPAGFNSATTLYVIVKGITGGTSSSYDLAIDNFKIEKIPSCGVPTALSISNLTATTAKINWALPVFGTTPVAFKYEVRTFGAAGSGASGLVAAASGTTTGAPLFVNVSGLSAQTNYSVYVQTSCGGGDFSTWTTAVTFITPCNAVSVPTTLEQFTTTSLPNCWSTSLITGTTNWAATSSNDGVPSAYSGTYFMGKAYNNSDALVASLPFNMTTAGANGAMMSVYIYRRSNGLSAPTDRIRFYFNTQPNIDGATQLLEIFPVISVAPTVSSAGWYNYTVLIPSSFNTSTSAYIIAQGTTSTGSSSFGLGFDDLQILNAPTCFPPSATITNITDVTATLNFVAPANGSPSTYDYEVRTTSLPGSGPTNRIASGTVASTTSSVNVTSLLASTNYKVYVRSNCTDSTTSSWSTAFTFRTECPPVASLNENFDSATRPSLPACWSSILRGPTVGSASVTTYNFASPSAPSSPNAVQLYNAGSATSTTDDVILVSPYLSNVGGANYRLRFNAAYSTSASIQVGTLSSSKAATAVFNNIQTIALTGTNTEYIVEFNNYTGPDKFIGIRMNNSATFTYVYIDNVVWEPMPLCNVPRTISVTNVIDVAATINWTAPGYGTPLNYEYEVRTSGTAGSGSTGLVAAASGTTSGAPLSVDITGLTLLTNYTVYVRSSCANSEFSPWSAGTNFRTTNVFCTGTPIAGSITQSNITTCSGATMTTLTLTGANPSDAAGISYQWQQSATLGGTYVTAVGGTGATTSSYTPPNTIEGTLFYRCTLRCSNGNATASTTGISVTITVCTYDTAYTASGVSYTSIMPVDNTNTIGDGTGLPFPGWQSASSSGDDNTSTTVNLTTTFKYQGNAIDGFQACTNGWITFNTANTAATFTNNLAGTAVSKVLAPFWDDLVFTGTDFSKRDACMRYSLSPNIGSGNGVITIEWAGMERYTIPGPNLNFQVKLYENGNRIEFIYGNFEGFDGTVTSAYSYSIGYNSSTPSVTGASNRFALQTANANHFSTTTDPANLIIMPACNSMYSLTPSTTYTGLTTAPAIVAPSNDNRTAAISLTPTQSAPTTLCGSYYTSRGATDSGAGQGCALGTGFQDDDVWFSFPASGINNYTIRLRCSPNYDGILQLFGTNGTTSIACVNATANGAIESYNTALLPAGTYFVRVFHNGTTIGTSNGQFALTVNELILPPTNDDITGATILTNANSATCITPTSSELPSTLEATASTTVPAALTGTPDDDVWYSFDATSTLNKITVQSNGNYNAVMQVLSSSNNSATGGTFTQLAIVNATGTGGVETYSGPFNPGDTYFIRVYHSLSRSANGSFTICVTAPVPDCTTNIAPANANTTATVVPTLSWNAVAGATNYDIYIGPTAGAPGSVVFLANSATTSYTVTPAQALLGSTQYTWYVVPNNVNGPAACSVSNGTTFTTISSCTTPTAIAITNVDPISGTASLSWTAPLIGNTQSYQYAVTTSATAPTTGTTTSAVSIPVHSGLVQGSTYYLWVRTYCGGSDYSPWGSSSPITVPAIVPSPWLETFDGVTTPLGYAFSNSFIGNYIGYSGNPAQSITGQMGAFAAPTGTINSAVAQTVNVGPLLANQSFSLDYAFFDSSNPSIAPPANSGSFVIDISTDYGVTYAPLATAVSNNTTPGFTTLTYSLAAYAGQTVRIKITVTRSTGTYIFSFDNLSIQSPCSGTPSGGAINITTQSVCNLLPPTPLTVTGATAGLGISYQWEQSPNGTTSWVNAVGGSNATTTTYSPPVYAGSPIYYRMRTNCGSNFSYTSNTSVVNATPNAIPFTETFTNLASVAGWNGPTWSFTSNNAAIGNPGNNANTILFSSSPSAVLTTAPYGPVVAGQIVSLDYSVLNSNSPYAPPANGSGSFIVEISSDCGANFSTLGTIVNDGVTSAYTNVTFPLGSGYNGQNVVIRVTATWVSGSYTLSIDNLGIITPPPTITSFTPTSLCAGTAGTIVVTGTNFSQVTGVEINSVSAPYTIVSPTQISIAIPNANTFTTSQITVLYGSGLRASSASNLVFRPFPAPFTVTGNSTICSGGTGSTTQLGISGNTITGSLWTTSNPAVASVNGNGLVTGLTSGTATIGFSIKNPSNILDPLYPVACETFNSNTFVVTVKGKIEITEQPTNIYALVGSVKKFKVTASGEGNLSYQWYRKVNASTSTIVTNTTELGVTFSGATTNELTLTNLQSIFDGREYFCVVSTDSGCTSVNSFSGFITIGDISIDTDPVSVSQCNLNPQTFTAVVSSSEVPILATDLVDNTLYKIISTDTGSTDFTLIGAPNNTVGTIFTSDFSVNSPVGTGTASLVLTYQWGIDDPVNGFTPITNNAKYSGSTTPSLTVTPTVALNESYILRIFPVSTDPDTYLDTNPVLFSAQIAPAIGTQPTSLTSCVVAGTPTFSIATSGGVSSIQWQSSSNGASPWTNVGTGNSLPITVTTSSPVGVTYYRALVNGNGACAQLISNTVTLTISKPTVSVSQSAALYCSPGGTAVTLTATGSSSTGSTPITYGWTSSITPSGITGSGTSVTVTPTANATYTVTATDSNSCTAIATANVTVGSSVTATVTSSAAASVCPLTPVSLTSTVTGGKAYAPTLISNYEFENVTESFNSISGTGTSISLLNTSSTATTDDGVSAAQTLPFTFNYGGNNFTSFKINTNGWISFDSATTNTTGITNLYSPLSGTTINNVISAFGRDLDSNNSATASYYVQTTGTTPNRITVIEWANIKSYSTSTNPETGSVQIWLYEGSNKVDIRYDNFTTASARTSTGTCQVGLRGASSAATNVKSISNTGTWNTPTIGTSNSATVALGTFAAPLLPDSGRVYRFTPYGNSSGYTYAWSSNPAGLNANSASVSVSPAVTTTYTLNVTSQAGCSAQDSKTVTVIPSETISNSTATTCGGTGFTVTPSASVGTTYSWAAPSVSGGLTGGVSGSGATSISGTLNNPTNTVQTATYFVTPLLGGICTGTRFTVTVTVNPKPAISNMTASVCGSVEFIINPTNGTNGIVPAGTTYSWSAPVMTGGLTGGSSGSGLSNITQTLVNPDAVAQTATYTVTPISGGCTGADFTVTVTVNPASNITNMTNTASCGLAFSSTPVDGVNGTVPAGTTYSWSAPSVTGGITGGASGSGATSITGTLNNPTTDPQTATYTVTPSTCGPTFTVTVTVNPALTLSSTLTPAAICSNTVFTYTPTSITSGAVFTWTRAAVAGISNAAVTVAQSVDPSETLINTTANPINVVYVYALSANSCNNTQNVTVTVKPTPILSSSLTPASRCSNVSGTYTATSATAGTTFAWTRDAVAGISNVAGSGSSATATETLVNTTSAPVNVIYVYTLTANGCSNTQNVTVTVNPTPTLSSSLTASRCTSVSTPYTATSATTGTTFSWTRAVVTGISNVAASGSTATVTETLINITANPINVVYIYTLTANGCSNTQNVTVTVNPAALLSSPTITNRCNNISASYTATSATVGTVFSWTRAAVAGISNAAVTTPQTGATATETLVNTTTAPLNVIYVYTMVANTCSYTRNVTVTVYPTPILSSSLTASRCTNVLTPYTATSTTAGTTFSWTRAVVTGISNLAGSLNTATAAETLVNTTTGPIDVTYVYTLTANGCTNTQNVTVTVNPAPAVTNMTASTCSLSAFTSTPEFGLNGSVILNSTYSWSAPTAAGGGITGGVSGTGASITGTLSNATFQAQNAIYTVTPTSGLAGSCVGPDFTLTVTVNPTPVIPNQTATICSGTAFTVTPADGTPTAATIVPANTRYTWTVVDNTSVTGDVAQATSQASISQTLTNTSASPQTVVYTVTPISGDTGSCVGAMFTVTVTVNPTPSLSSTLTPTVICSGTTFAYTATSATSGATFGWSRALVSGISQGASSGTGNVSQTLTNTTTAPIVVTYVYTTTANSCNNAPGQNVTVTVNPTPTLSSSLTASRCNNISTSYTATSATTGTTFSWTRAAVTGISNAAVTTAQNSATATETLVNTTTAPVNVIYVYTLLANGCSNTQNVTVTVNPTPTLSSTLTPTAICSGTTFGYTPTSATTGSTFGWSRALVSGISQGASSGTGNVSETLTNTTTAPIVVTYVYTTTANTCSNAGQNVTVTVNPTPTLSSTLTPTAICSGATFGYTPTSATTGATFGWSRAAVTGISQVASSGTGSVSEILTNTTTAPIVVTYVYTTTANSCNNAPGQNVTITVNPTPTLSSSLTASRCNNISTSYTATSATTGTTFSWTRAAVAGISNVAVTTPQNSATATETLVNTTTAPVSVIYVYTLLANGCSNTQNVTVTVNPLPDTPTISANGSTTICLGTSVDLTASSGTTYLWSTGATTATITVSTAGNYSVQVTNSFGCQSASSVATTVTVTPQPMWYLDADGDGYSSSAAPTSNPAPSVASCTRPVGNYKSASELFNGGVGSIATDCVDSPSHITDVNPTNVSPASINPGRAEICYNNIDDNCNGQKSENTGPSCPAVPVTVVNPGTITNFSNSLSCLPYTYAGASSLAYRIEIERFNNGVTTGQLVTLPTQSSRFFFIPTTMRSFTNNGITVTYKIRASAVINGEEVAYALPTITVNSYAVPKVQLTSCPTALSSIGATISANPGFNAQDYTFRIRLTSDNGPSPTYYYITNSASRFVNSNSFAGLQLQYGESYQVSVNYRLSNNGNLEESGWGDPCTMTTPTIPVVGIASPVCGTTVTSLGAGISAYPATYADRYKFRIRLSSEDPNTATYYYTSELTSRFTNLTAFGTTLAYNTSYSISVQYRLSTSGNTWSNFGAECAIITPFYPTVDITCNPGITSLTQSISFGSYVGFPTYKIRLIELDSNLDPIPSSVQYITRTYTNFTLSMFTTHPPVVGKNYNADVAVILNGIDTEYGRSCTILTVAPLRPGAAIKQTFNATAYPNPFANNFLLDVKSSSTSMVNVKVYDMLGRLIEQRDANIADMATTTIGERYPSGVYNVVVSQEDNVQTVRVVKR